MSVLAPGTSDKLALLSEEKALPRFLLAPPALFYMFLRMFILGSIVALLYFSENLDYLGST